MPMPTDHPDPNLRLAAILACYAAQLATFRAQSARLKVQGEVSAELLAQAHERIIRRWR
jgi:hypothetical protein